MHVIIEKLDRSGNIRKQPPQLHPAWVHFRISGNRLRHEACAIQTATIRLPLSLLTWRFHVDSGSGGSTRDRLKAFLTSCAVQPSAENTFRLNLSPFSLTGQRKGST